LASLSHDGKGKKSVEKTRRADRGPEKVKLGGGSQKNLKKGKVVKKNDWP